LPGISPAAPGQSGQDGARPRFGKGWRSKRSTKALANDEARAHSRQYASYVERTSRRGYIALGGARRDSSPEQDFLRDRAVHRVRVRVHQRVPRYGECGNDGHLHSHAQTDLCRPLLGCIELLGGAARRDGRRIQYRQPPSGRPVDRERIGTVGRDGDLAPACRDDLEPRHLVVRATSL
jgi:hypothetical protein